MDQNHPMVPIIRVEQVGYYGVSFFVYNIHVKCEKMYAYQVLNIIPFHTQQDRRHKTTTKRKSVKN